MLIKYLLEIILEIFFIYLIIIKFLFFNAMYKICTKFKKLQFQNYKYQIYEYAFLLFFIVKDFDIKMYQ